MKIKKYANGNFTVKIEPEYDSEKNLIVALCNSHELDFTIAGEPGSMGNWDMFYPLYNYNTDLVYFISGDDCERYEAGQTVRLYGHKPDDDERAALDI